jgi:nicotinate dehydrogenase subunit A
VVAPARARLLDVLRDELGLKGTRFGCGTNECGACHVLLDGRSVAACDTPLWAAAGHEVTTVEGLPERLREAFVAEQAAQCGYCSSGMLVAAAALLRTQPHPTEHQVRESLDGHLCRCGVHNRIVRAVLRAAAAVG